MPQTLRDKWILITGASSGFGAAAAKLFASEGARLLLGARRLERLQEIADEAMLIGTTKALFHALDVTDVESVSRFHAWVREHTGQLDVLLNCAGGAIGLDSVAAAKDDDWEFMFQANVLGTLRMTRASLPLLLASQGSSIVNIGSVAGRSAYEGGAAYCGAKAAVLQITRALRLELCGTGVRVMTVDPGLAETEFSVVRFRGDEARAKKVYEGTQPLTAQDIAETLLWVLTRPAHVCIDELVIKPTDQASVHKIHRRS